MKNVQRFIYYLVENMFIISCKVDSINLFHESYYFLFEGTIESFWAKCLPNNDNNCHCPLEG
jgi:hypothetical protein